MDLRAGVGREVDQADGRDVQARIQRIIDASFSQTHEP